MAPVTQRSSLSIALKLKILEDVDKKLISKTAIAKKYNIAKSTLSTILKQRPKIITARNDGIFPDRTRTTAAKFPEFEKAMLEWLTNARSNNIPVDGVIFKAKAESFALQMGIEDFKCSDGWLQRFKVRHGLRFKKLCGESAAVNLETVKKWKEETLKNKLSEYAPKDIFNADETGLFYKMLPDRSLVFKNEKCSGGKRAKQRITILMCANMDGSEKLPLFVIGKYKKPRCFKGLKVLPKEYDANSKAWMTSIIFNRWVRELDMRMKVQKRKILLIVDNCSAHEKVDNLEAVELVFLPPNVTSVMQPLDQGVIQSFKKHYRRMLLNRVILNYENGKEYEIDILGAIHLSTAAWGEVTENTIANCFCHAGFKFESDSQSEDSISDDATEDESDVMKRLREHMNLPETLTFQNYVESDSQVEWAEELSESKIIQRHLSAAHSSQDSEDSDNSNDEMDDSVPDPRPTVKDATSAVEVLQKFFEGQQCSEKAFKNIISLEKLIYSSVHSFKQTSIMDYMQ